MKLKKTIKKIFLLSAWVLVGCSMIVLLAAANRKQGSHFCKNIAVSIKGDEQFFLDKGDIIRTLQGAQKTSFIKKPVTDFNLSVLEKRLEAGAWVRDAQLYFDGNDVLHVAVWEREPIARVFTTSGASFYIDSAGKRMPLLQKLSARLPVITNFTAAKKLSASDSSLLKDLTQLVQYIAADDFWSAQIAQIDITPTHTLELTPVVGNHIIRLGTPENFEEKLARLFLFYKQVLSKTGFDKYAVLDVQYKNQVVASQKNIVTGIDSAQLQKNINELITQSKLQASSDSLALAQQKNMFAADSVAQHQSVAAAPQNPIVVKPLSKPVVDKKRPKDLPQPKAVMKKRTSN